MIDLDEIEELARNAAFGPLKDGGEDGDYPILDRLGREVGSGYDRGTSRFFARARTIVPELVAEIRRLRAERDGVLRFEPGTFRFVIETERDLQDGEPGDECETLGRRLFLTVTGFDPNSSDARRPIPREFRDLFYEVTHFRGGGFVYEFLPTPTEEPDEDSPLRALAIPAKREPTEAEFRRIREVVSGFSERENLGKVRYWTVRGARRYIPFDREVP